MSVNSLYDLYEKIGFAAIDAEISAWIDMGEFDEAAVKRAQDLGWIPPTTKISDLDNPLFNY